MFSWLKSLFARPNIICVRDPLDDGKEDSIYPTEFAAMMGRIRQEKEDCEECNGRGGRWDDESIDQWYPCRSCRQ